MNPKTGKVTSLFFPHDGDIYLKIPVWVINNYETIDIHSLENVVQL